MGTIKRIESIDLAKGIAILLVIVGHTCGGILRGAIFSFHMPLFFVLSCVTYKYSNDIQEFKQKVRKSFKHLVLPAIVIFFVRTLFDFFSDYGMYNSVESIMEFIHMRILTFLFSSGVPVQFGEVRIEALGIPWFLIVLFLGRTVFDYFQMLFDTKRVVFFTIILSVIGVLVGKIQYLPFSLDVVFAIMPLFLCGFFFYKFKIEERAIYKFFVCSFSWLVLFLFTYIFLGDYLELADRRYTLVPMCWCIALFGVLAMMEFATVIDKWKIFKALKYIGKNSLYMLCVHMLDTYLLNWFWNNGSNVYVKALLRVFIDIIAFYVVMLCVETVRKKRRQINSK